MEPALSSTILKFLLFFLASMQAKTAGISKLLMIRLVPSFKLKTKYLYQKPIQCILKWPSLYIQSGKGPFFKPMFTVSDSGSSRYALVLQCPFPFFFLVSNSFRIQDDSCITRAKTQRPREAIPLCPICPKIF